MDYENKPDGYYNNSRKEMLVYLPNNAKTVLDVGCGNGTFSNIIIEKTNAEVWGIELMEKEAEIACKHLHKVFTGPCEEHIISLPENYFEVIYFNDVLEHLVNPYQVLKDIKSKLTANGIIISSIPNIRYHNTFMKLLINKDWKYEDYGVLDRTHLRFFTKKSIKRMYEEAGYSIKQHHGINKSKSIKPYLYNLPVFFTSLDIRYPQYATIASKD